MSYIYLYSDLHPQLKQKSLEIRSRSFEVCKVYTTINIEYQSEQK